MTPGGGLHGKIRNKWSKGALTYKFVGQVDSTSRAILEALYRDAANAWSAELPLSIIAAGETETADIIVNLCPACLNPPCCTDLRVEGQMFWGWATLPNGDQQTDQIVQILNGLGNVSVDNLQFALILHEMGHSLGLEHSDASDAVMYEFIDRDTRMAARARLTENDILAAQRLYGSKNGDVEPLVPVLPASPDDVVQPTSDGLDTDGDGLSDTFELFVSNTNPNNPDSDGDGLNDGFEVEFGLDPNNSDSDGDGRLDQDEIDAGTPARAPLICDALSTQGDDQTVWIAESLFEDAGFVEGEVVAITNLRNGCSINAVTLRSAVESPCTLRMPRQVREQLCVFQLNVAVPLRFCREGITETLFDFQGAIDPPIVNPGNFVELVDRNGSRKLKFTWSLPVTEDDPYVVLVFDGVSVKPCDRILCDVEVSVAQTVRKELKTTEQVTKETRSQLMSAGAVQTVEVVISERYALGEIAFVIERDVNESTVTSGVVWIDDIRLVHEAVVFADPPSRGTGKMYWTDNGADSIRRADLDGSDVETLPISGLRSPQGIAVDSEGGRIYWTDSLADKIQSANLDGSDVEDLQIPGLISPQGIAVDPGSGKMYWTDNGADSIRRANLDGSAVETLPIAGLLSPQGIAVDPIDGKIYWTDWIADKIQRANLDGSGVEDLPISGLASPQGIAVDSSNRKIYWTDNGTDLIRRANLDGTLVEDLPISGLLSPQGIAVDPNGQKIYWTDWLADKIQSANLDGSGVEDLQISELASPQCIALIGSVEPDIAPPPDGDSDGVSDSLDQCPGTQASLEVDPQGCSVNQRDADADGVTDELDQCSSTQPFLAVDSDGCAGNQRDSDGDGVTDDLDQCPGTEASLAVDSDGCAGNPQDSDGDGVTDDLDLCPGTADVPVDATGCPLDLPPELSVATILLPGSVIGGIGPRDYGVQLRNSGSSDTAVTARVCILGDCGEVTVQVPSMGETTGFVSLFTPLSSGSCGAFNDFTVTACSLFVDSNPANDCLDVNLPVAVPFWDLRFSISGPSSTSSCGSLGWNVEVANVGNINSMNVCAFTALCRFSAPGNNQSCFPFVHFTTPNIAPGQTWLFPVTNYFICNSFIGEQFLKAEINMDPGGCFDLCGIGNFVSESIDIRP